MASAGETRRLTFDEYRELELTSETKHEWVRGEIFAMAGAKRAHNRVAVTLATQLEVALQDRPCLVFNSDMRVRTADDVAAYPDVSALCGEPRFDAGEDELQNPTFIAEVLSPSTEAYDRGEKFEHYRTMPSLQEYLLASSTRPLVEVYRRESDGWKLRVYGPGDRVELASLGCQFAVEDVYRKVFPAKDEGP